MELPGQVKAAHILPMDWEGRVASLNGVDLQSANPRDSFCLRYGPGWVWGHWEQAHFVWKPLPSPCTPTAVAFNNQKVAACSYGSKNCYSGSQRSLTDNCHTISKGLCCRKTWETWNSGGCGSVQREPPCFMEAGSEDIIRSLSEGPLLGKVWMAMKNGPWKDRLHPVPCPPSEP